MSLRLGVPVSVPDVSPLVHKAEILRVSIPQDQLRLLELRGTAGIQVHDTLASQLKELVRSLQPSRTFTQEELTEAAIDHLKGTPAEDYGAWVFYPWSGRLVHLLDEEEFAMVRTDRNRNKITREEQLRLSRMKVGIVGLSVGRSVALAMALERSFGELRLADHDTLDLSNLNRIKAGVHELGWNKCIATAREIAELDPFLKVTCQVNGLNAGNIDAFFTEGGNLDMLVEECDSVDIKILVRRKAKALGIPVVMDTSDRGMVDIERFDLEPDRPILHGLIDHLDLDAAAKAKTNEEKIPFLAPIAGMDQLSPRMKASMVEIGQSITTWPQLATGVILGGALVGDAYRRIALDEFKGSGRWYVDIDRIVGDAGANDVSGVGTSASPETNGDAPTVDAIDRTEARRALDRVGPSGPGYTEEQATALAQAGAAAPSADNMQPWFMVHQQGALHLFHDRSRSASALDAEEMIPHIALGMCLENILLTSSYLGIEPEFELWPSQEHPALVASVRPGKAMNGATPRAHAGLAAQITSRHTNRKHGNGSPLPAEELDQLIASVATVPEARAHVLTERNAIDALARVCGAADRLRVMNEHGHSEFFNKQLRWTRDEAQRTMDGLDIETLELTASERVGLRMASSAVAMRAIRGVGGGKALEKISAKAVRSASAIFLVTMPVVDRLRCIHGGRASERLWLKATELGISVHPLSAPVFLARPAKRVDDPFLNADERREALAIHGSLRSIFGIGDREPVFMTGLSRTGAPSARSLRRPLKSVFIQP